MTPFWGGRHGARRRCDFMVVALAPVAVLRRPFSRRHCEEPAGRRGSLGLAMTVVT